MGQLDDAIREHLDLKRRRGAEPGEVERAEREALGPVRRGPEEGPSETDHQFEGEPSFAYDHEDDAGRWDRQLAQGPERSDAQPLVDATTRRDERLDPDSVPESYRADDPFVADEPLPAADRSWEEDQIREGDRIREEARVRAEDRFSHSGTGAISPPHAAQTPVPRMPGRDEHLAPETAEYDVERALSKPAGIDRDDGLEEAPEPGGPHTPEGDDVLEETPEFLQDAPEHDRLWFEQRPPRDFDFDG
ncbi:MAG: hypothetical protein ACR2LV_10260 [Solirubrobacteraceae bacterium]